MKGGRDALRTFPDIALAPGTRGTAVSRFQHSHACEPPRHDYRDALPNHRTFGKLGAFTVISVFRALRSLGAQRASSGDRPAPAQPRGYIFRLH